MDRRYSAFRYLAYSLELVLLFITQSTPRLLPEVFGSKPLLLLPAVLLISFMESEIPAMFFGLAGGLMIDFSYSDTIGFFTFFLTVICFFVSLIYRDNFVVSFINATAFMSIICSGLLIIYFLFFYVFAGKADALYYFAHHYISRIIYTVLCGMALYFLNKFLFKNLRDN